MSYTYSSSCCFSIKYMYSLFTIYGILLCYRPGVGKGGMYGGKGAYFQKLFNVKSRICSSLTNNTVVNQSTMLEKLETLFERTVDVI